MIQVSKSDVIEDKKSHGSVVNVILLDGPKGVGKTTVGKLLKDRMTHAVFLSGDDIRRSLPGAQANARYNQIAFDLLLRAVEQSIVEECDVIIDCGLTQERLIALDASVKRLGAVLHKYSLRAPREVLFDRVVERDTREGKITNRQRFDVVHDTLQSKDFVGYTIFDTHILSPDEIADSIISSCMV